MRQDFGRLLAGEGRAEGIFFMMQARMKSKLYFAYENEFLTQRPDTRWEVEREGRYREKEREKRRAIEERK